MNRAEFGPAARAETRRAFDRYEREYPGRGLRFVAALERAVRAAAAMPGAGAAFPGVPEHLRVRRRIVRGFPYAIAYRDLGDVVRIDAVIHERRPPGYWHKRIKPL